MRHALDLLPRDLVALPHLRDRRNIRVHRHEQFQAFSFVAQRRRRSKPQYLTTHRPTHQLRHVR